MAATPPPEDEFPDSELTPAERKRVRAMLEAFKYSKLFWSTVRTWVLGAGALAVALSASWTWIKDAARFLAKQ